jgi:hypothetical protein
MTSEPAVLNAPVVLGPNQPAHFYRGGAGIARFRGTTQPSGYSPEDWIGSTTDMFSRPGAGLSRLDSGETLRDAITAQPAGFLGPDHVARFGADPGLLVKMLDTDVRLVTHFHPDRDFAAGITLVELQEPTDFSILLEWAGFAIDGVTEGHLGLGFDLALTALDYSGWDERR